MGERTITNPARYMLKILAQTVHNRIGKLTRNLPGIPKDSRLPLIAIQTELLVIEQSIEMIPTYTDGPERVAAIGRLTERLGELYAKLWESELIDLISENTTFDIQHPY